MANISKSKKLAADLRRAIQRTPDESKGAAKCGLDDTRKIAAVAGRFSQRGVIMKCDSDMFSGGCPARRCLRPLRSSRWR